MESEKEGGGRKGYKAEFRLSDVHVGKLVESAFGGDAMGPGVESI